MRTSDKSGWPRARGGPLRSCPPPSTKQAWRSAPPLLRCGDRPMPEAIERPPPNRHKPASQKRKRQHRTKPMLPLDEPWAFPPPGSTSAPSSDLVDGVLDLFLGVAVVLLNLAGGLVDRAFGLEVGVVQRAAGGFLHLALGLFNTA